MNEKQLALTKIKMSNPVHFLALGFGSGLISPAPGTWGTIVGWLMGIFLLQFMPSYYLLVLAIPGFILGV